VLLLVYERSIIISLPIPKDVAETWEEIISKEDQGNFVNILRKGKTARMEIVANFRML